jgi:hypothetical protein
LRIELKSASRIAFSVAMFRCSIQPTSARIVFCEATRAAAILLPAFTYAMTPWYFSYACLTFWPIRSMSDR